MISGAFIRRAVACLLIAGLTGCGGGGSSSTSEINTPVVDPPAGVVSGIAVDPYIKGAKFQEFLADGTAADNISSASDDNGKFTFSKALTQGSTIKMIVPGLHNGELYTATLKRKVDATTGELVSSPITTLLADGVTEDDLAAALGVAKEALKSNPMVGIDKGGDISETDLSLLKASILAHAAVQNPGKPLAEAIGAVKPIVDQLTAAELKTSLTVLNAVVALRDFALANPTMIIDPVTALQIVKEAYSQSSTGSVTITQTQTGMTAAPKTEPVAQPTAKAFFDQGMTALQAGFTGVGSMGQVQEAANKFKAAEGSIDSSTAQADKDAILFFSAFSQLATLAETASGDGTGLNRLGDLLDAFGVAKDGRNLFQMIELPQECKEVNYGGGYTFMECNQLPLPATTPTTGAIQGFLSGKLAPQLQAVVTSLGKVSSSFNYSWADPGDVAPTEIDHADVLIFKAVAQGILGQLNIQAAYNVDVDLYAQEQQDATDTPQAFLERNPELGKLVDVAKLTQAKIFLSAGLTDMENALAAIKAETDDQMDDLIAFYSPADMTMAEEDLALAKAALGGEITLPGTSKSINVAKFFSPGIDLRTKVPVFTDDLPGLFPDATLGGVLVSGFDLNADLDADGAPDLLKDYSQFSDAVMTQQDVWNGGFWLYSLQFELSGVDKTFSATDYSTYPSATINGTWKVESGKLILTDSAGTIWTLTMVEGMNDYLHFNYTSSTGTSGEGGFWIYY